VEEEDKIKKALLKKALGYNADEIVEEYAVDNGEQILLKKKITKKHYSPDINAVKVLLTKYYKTYEEKIALMSDDELFEEEKRLLNLLKEENDDC